MLCRQRHHVGVFSRDICLEDLFFAATVCTDTLGIERQGGYEVWKELRGSLGAILYAYVFHRRMVALSAQEDGNLRGREDMRCVRRGEGSIGVILYAHMFQRRKSDVEVSVEISSDAKDCGRKT
jgi:hypothetical protein